VTEAGSRCINTPTETNWEGEEVVKQKWYDKTLFQLFDGKLKVTSGMAIGAVVGIIVVALLVTAIMSYIAYVKRDKIATEMRRVSSYARRTSQKIRGTLSGKPAETNNDPNHPDNKENPVNNAQRDILQQQKAAGDVEMAADKDKDMGEEEHKFDDKAPAAA
jgi:hypothetical protein